MTRRTRKTVELNKKYEYDRGFYSIEYTTEGQNAFMVIFYSADNPEFVVDINSMRDDGTNKSYRKFLQYVDEMTGQLVKFGYSRSEIMKLMGEK